MLLFEEPVKKQMYFFRQQLEQARQRNMKRLVIELDEKNTRLRNMTVDLERSAQIEHSNQSKIQR